MAEPAEQTSFSIALNEIAADGTASAQEMAVAAGCSESHMRSVISVCNPTQLGPRCMVRLSHWLATERDETRHLEMETEDGKPKLAGDGQVIWGPDDIRNDDCLHDEMAEAQKHLADADRKLKEGDREGAEKDAKKARARIDEAIADIEHPAA
jgi:hypothetical protein